MKKELVVNVSTTPSKFFGKLFEARDTSHLTHLAENSFAKHIALDEFYKGIIKLTDELIESYQGKYGIADISIPSSSKQDAITYLQSFTKYIETNRSTFKDSYLQNIIDEILKLANQTLYKLINLK